MFAAIARQAIGNHISPHFFRALLLLLLLVLFTTKLPAAEIHATRSIVDDYSPTQQYRDWFDSRIGTDRGEMGAGTFQVTILHPAITCDSSKV